jgi:hypothetical protein
MRPTLRGSFEPHALKASSAAAARKHAVMSLSLMLGIEQ